MTTLKTIGALGIAAAIVGIILVAVGFGSNGETFMLGGVMTCVGFFVGVSCLFSGFRPEITKLMTKTNRYIQEENKEDLTEMASTGADIASDAITKVTRAVKEGLEESMFCKHCGAKIDADSNFCNRCGGKQ